MPLTRSELKDLATQRQEEKKSRLEREAKDKAKKIKEMKKHLIAICHKSMKKNAKLGEFSCDINVNYFDKEIVDIISKKLSDYSPVKNGQNLTLKWD